MEELKILRAPEVIKFRVRKSLKAHLVRTSHPTLNNILGSEPSGKRNYQFYKFIINTATFSRITTDETFKTNKGSLICNAKKDANLSECENVKICM